MSLVTCDEKVLYAERSVQYYLADPSFETFVAKIQKVKTRKDKDYFVLRVTIPKEISEKINAKSDDYLFFKTKKAEWYHMLDWNKIENTWQMLPSNIKDRIILDGVFNPSNVKQMELRGTYISGTPNTIVNTSSPSDQIISVQTNHNGDV